MYVFRTWITRNGERIYAKDYGKKAFRFWVAKQKILKTSDIFDRGTLPAWYFLIGREKRMAKTKSSNHGKQQKKIVTVHGYTKSNGVRVKNHRRSTPN